MTMKTVPAACRFFVVGVTLVCAVLLASTSAMAKSKEIELEKYGKKLEPAINDGLAHLFELLNDTNATLDSTRLDPLADYIIACDTDPRDYEPTKREGQGIVFKTELDQPIEKVIRYLYNPQIPNYILVPSVLRISGWYPESEIFRSERPLWQQLDRADPYMVRGREFEECTPDSFAGAYYRYDLKRLIIVYPYKGRKMVFSISEQPGESQMGKKGAIVDDSKWQYFYSGIEGVDKGLFSSLDTYMYASSSVQAYVDLPEGGTRNILFKWLSAGWSGMNFVLRTHIYTGTQRFSDAFKAVIESESLPEADELAGYVDEMRNLPKVESDARIAEYSKAFETACVDKEDMDEDEFLEIIKDGGYAKVLNRDDRVGILVIQKLKCALGLDSLVNMCDGEADPAVAAASVQDASAEATDVDDVDASAKAAGPVAEAASPEAAPES